MEPTPTLRRALVPTSMRTCPRAAVTCRSTCSPATCTGRCLGRRVRGCRRLQLGSWWEWRCKRFSISRALSCLVDCRGYFPALGQAALLEAYGGPNVAVEAASLAAVECPAPNQAPRAQPRRPRRPRGRRRPSSAHQDRRDAAVRAVPPASPASPVSEVPECLASSSAHCNPRPVTLDVLHDVGICRPATRASPRPATDFDAEAVSERRRAAACKCPPLPSSRQAMRRPGLP